MYKSKSESVGCLTRLMINSSGKAREVRGSIGYVKPMPPVTPKGLQGALQSQRGAISDFDYNFFIFQNVLVI